MANNKNNKQNRSLLDQSRTDTGNQYQDFINQNKTQFSKDQSDANGLRTQIQDKYNNSNNFMPGGLSPNSNGWFDLNNMPSMGGGTGIGGSGSTISAPDFSNVEGGYQDFARNGGVNRGDFAPALDSYKGFMSNGGIGESQADAMRARATAMVPSFYNAYKNNLQRRANVQGGYSPGFDAQSEELGRESARQGFQASRQVEGDIVDKRQQGMEFGTAGYGNLMSDITGKEQSGKLAGLGGLTGIDNARSAASNANAQMNAERSDAMQKFLMGLYSQGGQQSAQGLQSLYSSAPGNVGQTGGLYLGGLNSRAGNDLNNLQTRGSIQDRSWYDYVPSLLGAGGGFAGGLQRAGRRGTAS